MIRQLSIIVLALLAVQIKTVMGNSVSSNVNQFSMELYKNVVSNENGNLIMSPISAWTLLFMALIGSKKVTHNQLKNALHLQDNMPKNAEEIKKLIRDFNEYNSPTIILANQIFVEKGLLNRHYADNVQWIFDTIPQAVNFAKTDKAIKTINDWVAEMTEGKITEIVSSNSINGQTSLVLVNSLYFKGAWMKQFGSETRLEPFHFQDGSIKNIPMMSVSGQFKTGITANGHATFVELPYKTSNPNDQVSMYVIIPNENSKLQQVEANLENLQFSNLLNGVEDELVFSLPKFQIESTIDLESSLIKLGISNIFDNSADFSSISKTPLKVSNIIQKVFINVTEFGTEAAAATEGELNFLMGRETTFIKADKPFFVLICTKDVILFSGRIVDPRKTEILSRISDNQDLNTIPIDNDQIYFPKD